MTTNANPFMQADGKKPSCMEMLQLILDNQASKEQRVYFKEHMDRCLPCYKNYNLDQAIKDLLKAKCKGEDVPSDLVDMIKSQIGQNIAS